MTFNDMLARFSSIFRRDDCLAPEATVFLTDGIARIQRECRLANMERQSVITTISLTDFIMVPQDLLEIVDVFVPDQDTGFPRALTKLSYRRLMAIDPSTAPRAYARLQSQIWFRGPVPANTNIQLVYYGEFSPFTDGTATNEISATNPDLVIYAALSFAGDSYQHPAVDRWEARYQQILGQTQQQSADLDWQGGPMTVQPMWLE